VSFLLSIHILSSRCLLISTSKNKKIQGEVNKKIKNAKMSSVNDFYEKLIAQKDRINKIDDVQCRNTTSKNVESRQNVDMECRTVRVFISSTFKDFYNEREVLVRNVIIIGNVRH
jgi:hypothetical protein